MPAPRTGTAEPGRAEASGGRSRPRRRGCASRCRGPAGTGCRMRDKDAVATVVCARSVTRRVSWSIWSRIWRVDGKPIECREVLKNNTVSKDASSYMAILHGHARPRRAQPSKTFNPRSSTQNFPRTRHPIANSQFFDFRIRLSDRPSLLMSMNYRFFVLLCAQLLEEVEAGFSPMRRRALCGAEGRIRHGRTWTA